MGTALLTLGLAAAVAIAGTVVVRTIRELIESRLGSVEERFDRRLSEVHEGFDRRLEGLDGELLSSQQTAGQTATQIVDRLSKLDGTAAQMLQKAADLGRLEQALRPPKARGGVGEMLLANLLRDMLPADAYRCSTFRSGERVDAVIRVDKLLPVDAKFPLDNFERLATAEADDERELHEKAFGRDVKGHIDAIAAKYIRPARGRSTSRSCTSLPRRVLRARVREDREPASRSRKARHRRLPRHAPRVPPDGHAGASGTPDRTARPGRHAFCAQIGKDFDRFRGDFEVVGKHIANAQTKYSEADRRLERLGTSLERATEWEPEAVEAAEAKASALWTPPRPD